MIIQQRFVPVLVQFALFLALSLGSLRAQMPSPIEGFGTPLKRPLVLSGNFGELRSNHFHSGLDLKTNLAIGIPVYATADGFVSRIKVAHFGYGKALYLTHDDGYFTVYAHLDRFEASLQAYVKQQQYKKETFELELFPKNDLFEFKAGDLIGYTGNTGSSGGPHLHYEIRDPESRPLNPLASAGIVVKDTRRPVVKAMRYYPIDLAAEDIETTGLDLPIRKVNDSTYLTASISISGALGLGAELYDQQDAANNKNGVFQIEGFLNGAKHYEVTFDRISFDESRFMNRYMDYRYYSSTKKRVQKLFRESNNPIGIIRDPEHRGVLTIAPGQSYTYEIVVTDFHGNQSTILVPINGVLEEASQITSQMQEPQHKGLLDVFGSNTVYWSDGRYEIMIPRQTFYDPRSLAITVSADTLFLDQDHYPLQKKIEIKYDGQWMTQEDFDKSYIGRMTPYGQIAYQNTVKEARLLKSKVSTLGNYSIFYDRTPPSIKAKSIREGQWISKMSRLTVLIEDKESGISAYRATLNGHFILMEYDYKTKQLVYDFSDAIVSDTEQNLAVVVLDNVGNSATFELTFYRKND